MNLVTTFLKYKQRGLDRLWIHHEHIAPLLELYNKAPFTHSILGYSSQNTAIDVIQIGTGSIEILLWSQMHGDESTATRSIFDILKYFKATHNSNESVKKLLQNCRLTFIPILNPDGALAYTREQADAIDLNRDAIALKTPEAKVLENIINSLKPDYAFNLHDQTSRYNVSGSTQVATFSFLAPAEEASRKNTPNRKKAMRVIASMYKALNAYIPNQSGRYNDTYCETCFGDNIQKKAIPTILIESGHFPQDYERKETRKYHFVALLSGLFAISNSTLPLFEAYFEIPLNDKLFYDLRIDNVLYDGLLTSVAIRYIFKLENGKLIRAIDPTETIVGTALVEKLFHKVTDAKARRFSPEILDYLQDI